MRISDWSSDVCSSDLACLARFAARNCSEPTRRYWSRVGFAGRTSRLTAIHAQSPTRKSSPLAWQRMDGARSLKTSRNSDIPGVMRMGVHIDRKRVEYGKSGHVSVDLGRSRIIKKKKNI